MKTCLIFENDKFVSHCRNTKPADTYTMFIRSICSSISVSSRPWLKYVSELKCFAVIVTETVDISLMWQTDMKW